MPSNTSDNPPPVDATLTRNGGLTYIEIPTTNPNQSAAFYQSVVGWKIDTSDPNHTKFSDPTGHLIGRFITTRPANLKQGIIPFIYVHHLIKAAALVTPHHGQIIKPPYPEGNLTVALIRDPAGNTIGLWEEKSYELSVAS